MPKSRGAIGSRTLSYLLTNEGHRVGRWKARWLMQECGLQSRQPRTPRYRSEGKEHAASPNFLQQDFAPVFPNYLAVVMDLFSRRVVGIAMSASLDAELVCRALSNALETRHREGRLIFHSGQGSQYSSKRFRRLLWRNKNAQYQIFLLLSKIKNTHFYS
ncbi:DDE-type integrase/transposase/recombinase [Xenorhabdus bovienii]|uniref:DDE-type integrase/transposase/recombinase n=1 Tax=Xenorhabdus bovienii TaxID=40576 RepID=A0AAJ1J439_XENBV|nr:DDE-type integrase/transposase/recombinase [Xenorhabdus bovienii]MDE1476899.1 DDE-type integrase/transposase/recombinase [Xenorhabdus bovienii]MDE1485086.1 DDE-type integrase/transposase/recombinase [Xenorhabdus bovienii]MDE1494181.1 DDE-type integrase/transposase/recombinase [Xenorhabdus bovienii]MDE9444911.1 DDE-type integrase/transposase/recombinase [Xenorhabdus bovienii]MDE9472584.1 DDE-type integrase/transposase/recombinase [Xenorhabdus bovienii]